MSGTSLFGVNTPSSTSIPVPPSTPPVAPNPVTPPVTNPTNTQTPIIQQTDVLENFPIVKDPAFERMAFDVTQYPDAVTAIQGFLKGHRITVTYFQSLNQTIDVRTNIVDSPTMRANIHSAYRRINNLEITLQDPLQFTYTDPNTALSQVTGNAAFYPGMNPKIGDIFLLTVGDNKVGEFKITSVTPGSWRNQRAYMAQFLMFAYLSQDDMNFLSSATTQTVVFDKANFLGDTVSLLTEDKYQDLQTLRQMRQILALYYFRKFYDSSYGSFFRPTDQLYDPYVVKYMASAVEYILTKKRPQQLLANVDDTYDNTIWSRLNQSYNLSLTDLNTQYRTNQNTPTTTDPTITTLANHYYLVVDQQDMTLDASFYAPYIFSTAFYTGDTVHMSLWEDFVYQALTTRILTDTHTLITQYINTYQSLSPLDQFYHIPFYLALIDIAVQSITRVTP